MKWGWLFRTYVQWHAIAFLLSELCVRTKGEAVERAWRALQATAGRWWFPLNNTAPGRREQPGCLWKPLRKLLAKAKGARDRELALERASIALRNGQLMYPGFPGGLETMSLPSLSMNQPSSEDLDRLLRPSAPRLGESPQSQPSWPDSPPPVSKQVSFSEESTNMSGGTSESRPSTNGVQRSNGSPGQEFSNLLSFGLDNVLIDVMEDMNVDGTHINGLPINGLPINGLPINGLPINGLPINGTGMNGTHINGYSNQYPTTTHPPDITQYAQAHIPNDIPADTANGHATALQSAYGTFGDNPFSNVGYDVSPTMGQDTESPNVDGANMDWTMWDDMVSQYGMEGQATNTGTSSTNPASHLGLMRWF
jgi:hypothetical protein